MSEEKLVLSIAEIPFCFHLPSEKSFSEILREKYGRFIADSHVLYAGEFPAVHVSVNVLSKNGKKDNELDVRHHGHEISFSRGDMNAVVDLKNKKAELLTPPFVTSVDTFLRVCLTFLLLERGGFLLHSAGIISNGKGYGFFGPSGCGKTTLSEKFNENEILSDEVCAVTVERDGIFAHGTPFWGDLARRGGCFGAPVKFPLGGLFRIEKGVSFHCETMKMPERVRELLQSVIFYCASKNAVEEIFHIAADAAERLNIMRLWLAKDVSALSALKQFLERDKTFAYVSA